MSTSSRWLLLLAGAFAVLQVGSGLAEPYGLFHDEYYYWACAQRPGLGYVDHPPFAPWVLAAVTALLGDSLPVFGIVPAACGAAVVFLTGWMAGRFGAGTFGQCLAAACTMSAPIFLAFFNFYSVNAFEFLIWTLASCAFLELLRTRDERFWLALGALAGVGLLNKHTVALFFGALGLAVLATPVRAQLRSRWPWIGAALALLLASPNLVWNALHDWPSLAFYRSVGADKNLPTSIGDAITFQVAGANPATLLVGLPGLALLLFDRELRRFRALGIVFLVLMIVILTSGQRRGDRIFGAYPVVFAAGGYAWDRWARGRRWAARARWSVAALVPAVGLALLPISLPLFAPTTVAAFFEAIGESPELEAGDRGHAIPLSLLGRLEWDRLADEVLTAVEGLPEAEREHAVILTRHWVLAAAIEYEGRHRDAPPVVSPSNAYWFWRGESAGRDRVVAVGVPLEVLDRHFTSTELIGSFQCEYCANWRRDMQITLSRGPRAPIEELLEEWRHFGAGSAPALEE